MHIYKWITIIYAYRHNNVTEHKFLCIYICCMHKNLLKTKITKCHFKEKLLNKAQPIWNQLKVFSRVKNWKHQNGNHPCKTLDKLPTIQLIFENIDCPQARGHTSIHLAKIRVRLHSQDHHPMTLKSEKPQALMLDFLF